MILCLVIFLIVGYSILPLSIYLAIHHFAILAEALLKKIISIMVREH